MVKSKITKQQEAFLKSKSKVTIFRGGIGSGKTRILCTKAILSALSGRVFLLVSFSYPTLRDVCLKTLVELLEELKIKYTINRAEMLCKVGSGEILLRSGDNPDKLRGINAHDWGIDEAREFKDGSVYDILIGRARKSSDAQGFISTTTKGKNWVYELESREGVSTITQTTFDNPFLPKEYKEHLSQNYTSQFARQELYGDIVEMGAGVINPQWFNIIDQKPFQKACRFWDLAVSIKTYADNTSGALCSFDHNFTIHDIRKVKKEWPDVRRLIIETAKNDGIHVPIVVEEAGQQKGFIDDLKILPELRQYTIEALKPKGDKLSRAMPWSSRAELGCVDLVRGGWNRDFLDECASFSPDDSHLHDDQIDSVSGAYQYLSKSTDYFIGKARI